MGRKSPKMPTTIEIEERSRKHLPYRSWCQRCVMSRARSSHHRRRVEDDKLEELKVPRVHVAAYLCSMLLCCLPNNDFSCAELLCSNQGFQVTKLCCLLNYFRRLEQLPLDQPKGDITFVRSSSRNQFNWIMAKQTMSNLRVHTDGQVRVHSTVASRRILQIDA